MRDVRKSGVKRLVNVVLRCVGVADRRQHAVRCERVRKFFGTGKLGCGTPPADIASAVSENARVLVFVEAAHIGFVLGTFLAECKIRAFEMQAEESGRRVLFLGGTVDIDGLKKLGEVS